MAEKAERVPPELVTAFRASHGADVSDVPVHRGEEAARQAQAIQAGAFTAGGEVFLPAEVGPLTEPAARAMLAHELAHVVQQRTLGSALPDEHTGHGQELEDQARAHEHWARHGAVGAPPVSLRATPANQHAPSAPLIHPKVQRTPRSTPADAPASPPPAPSPTPASPPASPPGDATTSGGSASSSGSSGLTGSDAPRLVGGVRLPDDSWTQQHDAGNPRNAGELGNMFAESFGGLVLDEWAIDSSVPGADLERDTRRTQLRTQLLDQINHERLRQHLPLLPELGHDEQQLVEDQLDHERHTAQGLTGGGRGGGTGGRTGTGTTGGTGTATGTGRGSGGGSASQDDGRIHNFREFGGELALGAIDLLGGGMGIDLTADQENEIRGRPARATDSTGTTGAAHTDHATGTAHGSAHTGGGEHELIEPDRMDLDELAVRIYDRLRTRLRLELLVDRERAGLLSDFR